MAVALKASILKIAVAVVLTILGSVENFSSLGVTSVPQFITRVKVSNWLFDSNTDRCLVQIVFQMPYSNAFLKIE